MSDVTFRVATPSTPSQDTADDFKPNEVGAEYDASDIEPLEGREGENVMEIMGFNDDFSVLPPEEKDSLVEVEKYVKDIVEKKGVVPTRKAFEKVLNGLKDEMGLDSDAEPPIVLDRLSGVIKAWKGISFIKDPSVKRSLFMKLARANSSSEMNKIVFSEMEKHQIWQ